MSKKKIIFKPKAQLEQINKTIDDWVFDKSSNSENISTNTDVSKSNDSAESRFTIVIPTYLHRRIKKYCAAQGISIKEKLTEIFEEKFPQT